MDIICWLNYPLHHWNGIFRSLANVWSGKVTIIFEKNKDYIHKGLNFHYPCLGNANSIFLEQANDLFTKAKEIITANPNAIHIYFGFQPRNKFFQVCISPLMKITNNPKLVILSERPRQYTYFMGIARELNYRLNTWRYRSKISAVLALGNLGVTAFHRFGFDKTKIFPMSYCVDQQDFTLQQQVKTNAIRFIHLVGLQEHYCKGLDIIFKAFSLLKDLNWSCDILGFDQTDQLTEQLQVNGIEKKIRLLGKCKNTEVFEHVQRNDILLLPSRHDGWGVALAEGIFCGLGAIASNNVGSKDLIEGFQCGQIVKAGDVKSLADSIRFCIENRDVVEQWKSNAIKHRHHLTPPIIADYLKQILEYVFINNYQGERPVPPWELNYF